MTPEEKYALHYREMAKICSEQGWGDPFSYARSKEILAEMVESWVMSGDKVFEILVSKMESKFPTVRQKKDPRLSANISNTEIRKYGRRLI